MRLIDADKLKAEVLSWENCYNGFSDTYDKAMIIDTIDEQPTIDAVPVVRCGECKYSGESLLYPTEMVCKYHIGHTYYTEADRFCYYGERRSDGDI